MTRAAMALVLLTCLRLAAPERFDHVRRRNQLDGLIHDYRVACMKAIQFAHPTRKLVPENHDFEFHLNSSERKHSPMSCTRRRRAT
jgi:hypothetical protein